MPAPLVAAAAVGVAGSVMSSRSQSRAASRAADAQVSAANAGIAAERSMFDETKELLSPFVSMGESAIGTSGIADDTTRDFDARISTLMSERDRTLQTQTQAQKLAQAQAQAILSGRGGRRGGGGLEVHLANINGLMGSGGADAVDYGAKLKTIDEQISELEREKAAYSDSVKASRQAEMQSPVLGRAPTTYTEAALAGLGQMPGLTRYSQTGVDALMQQRALSGLEGPDAQNAAISQLEANPEFQHLVRSGEGAILQNASATGGLRGGNTQRALADYRTDVLSNLINQQYGRMGGLAASGGNIGQFLTSGGQAAMSDLARLGQASAANQAAAGSATAGQISNLLQGSGNAQANAALASGAAKAQMWNSMGRFGGQMIGGFMS